MFCSIIAWFAAKKNGGTRAATWTVHRTSHGARCRRGRFAIATQPQPCCQISYSARRCRCRPSPPAYQTGPRGRPTALPRHATSPPRPPTQRRASPEGRPRPVCVFGPELVSEPDVACPAARHAGVYHKRQARGGETDWSSSVFPDDNTTYARECARKVCARCVGRMDT